MAKQFKGNGKPKSNSQKPNGNGRGRGNGYRPKKDVDKKDTDESSSSKGTINNPAYYYADPVVLEQLMNFTFNEFGGYPSSFKNDIHSNTVDYNNTMVAAYYLNPSLPETGAPYMADTVEGVQASTLKNFTDMSKTNPNTTGYAPQDVFMAITSVRSLIETTSFVRRAFGVIQKFSYRNRNYPTSIITSMGIDADDLRRNIGVYRTRYNALLATASAIMIPGSIPIFEKARHMYESIYLDDADSALAQTYLFVPKTVWTLDEAYDPNGSGLVTTQITGIPSNTWKMSQVLDAFETMISRLMTSSTMNNIYANVSKNLSKGYIKTLVVFDTVDDAYSAPVVYNDEVKDWLHNAIIMGDPIATADQLTSITNTNLTNLNDVRCDAGTNRIIYHPQWKKTSPMGWERYVDFDTDNVTTELRVRAMRFSQRYSVIYDTGYYYTDETALNDYYITGVYFTSDGATFTTVKSNGILEASFTSSIADMITKFDWSPLWYVGDLASGDNYSLSTLRIIGDLDFYTLIDFNFAKKIFDYEAIRELTIE